MIKKRIVSPVLLAAAFAFLLTGSAAAQGVSDQRTYFTFSAPVQLPGVTLPAGKYTFRLADSQTNRHIVQIFNADGTKIFATFFAIPAERAVVPNDPEIQFHETPANMPSAIDIWYYPGTKTGHEFLYSKDESAKWSTAKNAVAKVSHGDIAPAWMTFAKPQVLDDAAGAANPSPVADVARTPAPTPANAPAMRPVTKVADSSTTPSAVRKSLPRTASSMPMVAMIGVLSLIGGALVSFRRRKA